ncbi:uracil-DNA glycosylase [Pseudohoeflea coraliihabitans]|uniref:uracil-DNA glycosylase n=1 Tax=Pseudohoeflea coraliihabitans TaxID=2860393 RepID=A0ABS6WRU4_9HYPH|nr:uracil-DNA glycosylase [Pseudohoeflea sp. DP4N28-3]MBW3098691.1 uracil-DNA glycosylase [Pseudohoeflea sp. DP4N28-3]
MTAPAPSPDLSALEALMLFYRDAGIDGATADAPVNRYLESQEAARRQQAQRAAPAAPPQRGMPAAGASAPPRAQGPGPSQAQATRPAASPPAAQPGAAEMTLPGAEALEAAQAAAAAAQTVEELQAAVEAFTGCNLRHSARSTVFSDGNPEAPLMLVGEAPGRNEDQQGRPFVGDAGRMLDRMLAAIGRDRDSTYITNVIYWRPPGNRTPTAHEIELCRPFAERHIALAKPKFLMFLGNVPSKTLLETRQGILSIRGEMKTYARGELSIPVMPTLHPAYLLRQPAQKKLAWADLLTLSALLEEAGI